MSERPELPDGRPDLEEALRRLARQVDVPTQPHYPTRVREKLAALEARAGTPRRMLPGLRQVRPLAATAGAVLLAIAVVLSVPASREAVADLFGFSGVRVRPLPSSAPSPRTTIDEALDLGTPVSLAEARRGLPFPVAVPSALGPPDAVYLRREQGLDSVSLVYRPRPGFPAAFDTRVGVLISEYAGSATPYFEKFVSAAVRVSRVTVDDKWPGLYFAAPQQVLIRDPSGLVHQDRPRLAAPTLVWVEGDVTFRLEARVGRAAALRVAASVR